MGAGINRAGVYTCPYTYMYASQHGHLLGIFLYPPTQLLSTYPDYIFPRPPVPGGDY